MVSLDGAALVTTYVSATELTAVVPVSELSDLGNHVITVSNFGNTSSSPYSITVQNAVYDISPGTGLSYTSVELGQTQTLITSIEVGGGLPLTIGQITLVRILQLDPYREAPTTSCAIVVAFSPNATGVLSAEISIPNNSTPNPATIDGSFFPPFALPWLPSLAS